VEAWLPIISQKNSVARYVYMYTVIYYDLQTNRLAIKRKTFDKKQLSYMITTH